jgi:tetratricopeptide (TPR) repeat protein
LTGAGFVTAAFIGAEVLDARYGLAQGFATYDEQIDRVDPSPILSYPERSGEEVAEAALRWLEQQADSPVFVWIHLYDPHTPYRPPEPERSRHASPYDGEIAYVDRVVGQILERWDVTRGLDRSLVVVTSDHGESLGEHGEKTHGVLVYDATLRVPLVIRAPGIRLAETITAPVHLIDVMPTMLSILDLPLPDAVQGRDLGPLLRGEPVDWTPVAGYAESVYAQLHHGCAPLFALRTEGLKLIRGLDDELYDLTDDPAEQTDRAAANPAETAELRSALAELADDLQNPASRMIDVDDESRRALDALGYLSTRSPLTAGLCDARDALASMARMADADRLALGGDTAGAEALYRAVIDSEPDSIDARVRLAGLLESRGQTAAAIDLLVEAVHIAPHESVLHYKLGHALELTGEIPDALTAFDAGLTAHPEDRDLRDGRWRCLNRLRRLEEMLAEAERAVSQDPTDGMARFARAVACCSNPLAVYIAALERELVELPADPFLSKALDGARAEAGR